MSSTLIYVAKVGGICHSEHFDMTFCACCLLDGLMVVGGGDSTTCNLSRENQMGAFSSLSPMILKNIMLVSILVTLVHNGASSDNTYK